MQLDLARAHSSKRGVPLVLKPVLRAYILGYASSTAPRLLTLLLTHLSKRRKNLDKRSGDEFLVSFIGILRGGLEWQRFPTFCGLLVGGSTLLQIPLRKVLERFLNRFSQVAQLRLVTWLSTFTAAWFSLKLLQSKKSPAFIEDITVETKNGPQTRPTRFAGRTMDLTIFAVTRALDAVVGELWSQRKLRRASLGKWTNLERLISTLADPAIFASSCPLIMWAWIYTPERLPRSYNKWIKTAAAVDHRLLLALRRMRFGEIKYGQETGQAYLLQSMCKDYKWPLEYGDPVQSMPFPCEVVHMGTGKSCEYHLLSRFVRSFSWSFSTYLPINLLLVLRNPSQKRFKHAFLSSIRSSAFLGSFIALYYYGICFARSRAGPLILGDSASACQQIDSGICVANGCALCGWSVMLENAGRQKELGLFVAPRALATLLPRRYLWEKQWRETLAFAVSTAVVFTCVQERPERVRGVLGKVLRGVLTQ